MSKWVNKEAFNSFSEEKVAEKEEQSNNQGNSFARKFRPDRGTEAKPKEYEIRALPDPKNNFYLKYYYHMFLSGEKWHFFLCPKTKSLDTYCPFCSVTNILYKGSQADKKKAYDYSKKERYVGNFYIINDPRDAEVETEEYKCSNTVRLYEFPKVVEAMFKQEVTDKKNGYGLAIFDPEDGYSFLLRIGAKKPDRNGKVWPDYSPSIFARKSSPIADDAEIENIMDQRYDLQEYLETLELGAEDMKDLLKAEMVWDDVERDFNRVYGKTDSPKKTEMEDDVPTFAEETDTEPVSEAPEPKKASKKAKKAEPEPEVEEDDKSDEDLLDELDNL